MVMAMRGMAMESAGKALELLEQLGMERSISAGTTYVNIATAYNAFGEYEKSMEMFRKAREAYESSTYTEPALIGGLYNNMALTCSALGQYEEALDLYEKAMTVMAQVPDGELEQAITCLNMANTVETQQGLERGENRIFELVERAEALLEGKAEELLGKEEALLKKAEELPKEEDALLQPMPGNETGAEEQNGCSVAGRLDINGDERARLGYFAFVCEKCAPTFSYYGYFLAAQRFAELSDRLAGVL